MNHLVFFQWLYMHSLSLFLKPMIMSASQQCGTEISILGKALKRHTFYNVKAQNGFECLQACNADDRCQSFNYVITSNMCELNNRTKEARPVDFVPDLERYYMKRDRERVPLGSIPALPAESCQEIKSCEGGQVVSGKYWFYSVLPGRVVHAHCDMQTEDLNECNSSVRMCHSEAWCQNTPGSFTCSCKTGFSGDGKQCTDIDECGTNSQDCDVNADCQNTEGSYTCNCIVGFTGDGLTCTDTDECSTNSDNCHLDGDCQNTDGSFTCHCKDGYTGNGISCTDLDECTANSHNCDMNAECQNTVGSYTCSCSDSFTGDGLTCHDIDECSTNSDNCHLNAECQNTIGSFTCHCKTGYTGNGPSCADINECQTGEHNCLSDVASCLNSAGSYSCACNSGYDGDGITSCSFSASSVPECQNYQTLTSADRSIAYTDQTGILCDKDITPGWYRFQGAAGTRMPDSCPDRYRCRTHVTGWLNGAHPTVAQGRVTMEVCGHWSNGCCDWRTTADVRNCGDFYVYYFNYAGGCYFRFCGTN